MAMGIDGLASGLDTTSLINQLMQVEAMPQTLLKSKQSSAQTLIQALQGLNTRVASLADAATKAAAPASWQAYTATSSAEGVTATTSATAQPGSISFHVDSVAQAQVTLTAAVADGSSLVAGDPPVMTVRKADGTTVELTPASTSLQDLATAINDSPGSGAKATVVKVTDGATPTYRLQLTATTTGEAGAIELFAAPAAEVAAYTQAERTTNRTNGAVVRAGTDASITLWKGTTYAETFSQASNTFTGLMTGVDVTVSAVTAADADPVTIDVAQDKTAVSELAKGLVGAMGVVLSEISSRTATTIKTGADGKTTVTGGLFSGDATVRTLRTSLTEAMSRPIDGTSPSEVGIVLGRDGSFTFDEAKFFAALAADPAKAQAVVAGLASRVADAASAASDKYDGALARKIQGQESMVRDMGTQIESWDRRLELRRAGLQRTYSALEITLSNLQGQSSWLAGQLASLPKASM